MRLSSIQEGGCTTPPRLSLTKLPDERVIPVLALLSPVGVLGILGVAASLIGLGGESTSLLTPIGVVALGLAVALCAVALWRARMREDRILSGIGMAGNAVLLFAGIVYLALR